jgi:hypothetical protein
MIVWVDNDRYKVRIYQKRPKHSKYNLEIENISNGYILNLPNNTPYVLNDKLIITLCYILSYNDIVYYIANNLSELIYACYNCNITIEELIEKYKNKNILIKLFLE